MDLSLSTAGILKHGAVDSSPRMNNKSRRQVAGSHAPVRVSQRLSRRLWSLVSQARAPRSDSEGQGIPSPNEQASKKQPRSYPLTRRSVLVALPLLGATPGLANADVKAGNQAAKQQAAAEYSSSSCSSRGGDSMGSEGMECVEQEAAEEQNADVEVEAEKEHVRQKLQEDLDDRTRAFVDTMWQSLE